MPSKSLSHATIGLPVFGMGPAPKAFTILDRGQRTAFGATTGVILHHSQVSDQKHSIFQANQAGLKALHSHIEGVACRCKRGMPKI